MTAGSTPDEAGDGPLDGYLTRDPDRWSGFAELPLDRLLSHYAFSEGEGAATLGEKPVAYRFRALPCPSLHSPFFFYFDEGRLACISTDFWSLDEAECRNVLRRLGPPPHRLDACFRDSAIPDGDWVFAERGLALCIVPATGLIARWTAYAPCTLAAYRERYRVTGLAREFDSARTKRRRAGKLASPPANGSR